MAAHLGVAVGRLCDSRVLDVVGAELAAADADGCKRALLVGGRRADNFDAAYSIHRVLGEPPDCLVSPEAVLIRKNRMCF